MAPDVKTEKFLLRAITRMDDLEGRMKRVRRRRPKSMGDGGFFSQDMLDLKDFSKPVLQNVLHESNLLTVEAKIDGWLGNLRDNLERIAKACKTQEITKGIEGPCIVAGGSNPDTPLIRKQLTLLHKPKVPVVACDRAFSFLAKDHWAPQYVVVLENNRDPNYDFLLGEDRKKLSKDVTLYASIITHPDILADWRGEIVFYRHEFPPEALNFTNMTDFLFAPLPSIWHGGNVGTCAYAIAVFLGAKPIALVGMDFGVESGHVDPKRGRQFVTEPILMAYAQAFSSILKVTAKAHIETYNCTGGGILRDPWIKEKTLEEFMADVS